MHVLYDKGRQAFATKLIDLSADTIKVVLVNIAGGHYAVDTANDQFLSAIASGDRIATTAALTSKTTTAGVFSADNTVFSAVPAGPAGGAIVIYQDTGVAGTSRLIAYIDDYLGLPVTPNGQDINITWPSDANKIFKL